VVLRVRVAKMKRHRLPPVLVPSVLLVLRVVLRVRVAKMKRYRLPPVLVPSVLLVLRVVLRVRVAKIAAVTKLRDLVHCDQRGMKRQRLRAL
jgi:hypothetical protein